MKKIILVCLLITNFVYGDPLIISSGPKTKILQKIDIPNTSYQEGMGLVHFLPNQIKPAQSQSGPELVYVVEGTIHYVAKGKPEKIIEQGQSYQISPGEVHYSKAGPTGATVVATWVFDKKIQFVKPEKQF